MWLFSEYESLKAAVPPAAAPLDKGCDRYYSAGFSHPSARWLETFPADIPPYSDSDKGRSDSPLSHRQIDFGWVPEPDQSIECLPRGDRSQAGSDASDIEKPDRDG